MGKKRLIKLIKTALREEGNLSVESIITVFQDRWPRQTPSTSEIASILTKNPEFIAIDTFKKPSAVSGTHSAFIWGLNE
tara:strand:+ start:187 stop:423 length:237 start_codon:yes stop_codon:yes gene_type:complete